MADGTDKTRNVEKLATEGQNTQPIHKSDGITPENLPVEEEREKTTGNEQNGEEQVDGATNDGDGTTEAQHDNVQDLEGVITETAHNPTLDTLEEGLEATELDENDANLQCKVVTKTVTKVRKPCACGSLTHSR